MRIAYFDKTTSPKDSPVNMKSIKSEIRRIPQRYYSHFIGLLVLISRLPELLKNALNQSEFLSENSQDLVYCYSLSKNSCYTAMANSLLAHPFLGYEKGVSDSLNSKYINQLIF